ncbi:16S rRNA (cytosine(1402)-N(4))-methyltransferase RsmH [Patescibacteria group bacterium]|nr:16S rRNA (cytosine(1402)-N(4))-methyltransferase RsmH [Patescibacteria group bacterium]
MALTDNKYGHESVLIGPVENYLNLENGDVAIDCTLGLGGHSEMFLDHIGSKGKLIAFEQDESNLKIAEKRLSKNKNKIIFIPRNFVHLQQEIEDRKISGVKLVFMDLGLASTQVDASDRGFSFLKDGPLDMRFDKRSPITAKEVLERCSEKRLVEIFREYGEERYSKKFARIIKENLPINTTKELADLIQKYSHTPPNHRGKKIHPATRIFQALRIEVNNELEVLQDTLNQAIKVLAPGGRLIVISYHSLEDRIVKHTMKDSTRDCICPREVLICNCNHSPELKILTKKPIVPTEEEIGMNPRSRSAKMRIAEKL